LLLADGALADGFDDEMFFAIGLDRPLRDQDPLA
jgi:hypothetical protein